MAQTHEITPAEMDEQMQRFADNTAEHASENANWEVTAGVAEPTADNWKDYIPEPTLDRGTAADHIAEQAADASANKWGALKSPDRSKARGFAGRIAARGDHPSSTVVDHDKDDGQGMLDEAA